MSDKTLDIGKLTLTSTTSSHKDTNGHRYMTTKLFGTKDTVKLRIEAVASSVRDGWITRLIEELTALPATPDPDIDQVNGAKYRKAVEALERISKSSSNASGIADKALYELGE